MIIASTIGQIFEPLFKLIAELLAVFYALTPNYAIAIALLTLAVMVVTAPLTIKSTKSMVAMQRLAPELKKIQQKYKGDRQQLNEEMMKLYRENNVSPAGGCLPMLIQMPVFIILYDVIRGLTNTITVHHHIVPAPRYIGHQTLLYKNLYHSAGKMVSFGVDLAKSVIAHHHSLGSAAPYWVMFVAAIVLQYLQINQINRRNPQLAQTNPQAQMMQKYMPIMFAVFYLYFPAGVVVYFIVSSLSRIAIQEGLFRFGMIPTGAPSGSDDLAGAKSSAGSSAPRRPTLLDRFADLQKKYAPAPPPAPLPPPRREPSSQGGAAGGTTRGGGSSGSNRGSNPQKPKSSGNRSGQKAAGGSSGGKESTSSGKAGGRVGDSNGTRSANGDGPPKATAHPRSKDKRERRAR